MGKTKEREKTDKHHKEKNSKGKKSNSAWNKEWADFSKYLSGLGLLCRDVESDGNCLFRAIADQLEGSEKRHLVYRKNAVTFMQEHSAEFAPFVEGAFSDYLNRMGRDGEWGGNQEIVASSRCFNCHITVHQHQAPCLEVRHPTNAAAQTIHISYHSGEHYCSVRNADDDTHAPAKPIKMQSSVPSESVSNRKEKIAMETTGCTNLAHVQEILKENWGDLDACLVVLFAEKQMGLDWSKLDTATSPPWIPPDPEKKSSKSSSSSNSSSAVATLETTSVVTSTPTPMSSSSSSSSSVPISSSSNDLTPSLSNSSCVPTSSSSARTTSPPPGAVCPCGSGKKFKKCCKNRKPTKEPADHGKKIVAAKGKREKLSNKDRKKQAAAQRKQNDNSESDADDAVVVSFGSLLI